MSNTIRFEEYSDNCIDTIFPDSTFLTISKRLQTYEDRNMFKQFKLVIFNADIPLKQTKTKYVKMINTIVPTNNISLSIEVCENVSKVVRNMKNIIYDYVVKEIICRNYSKYKIIRQKDSL